MMNRKVLITYYKDKLKLIDQRGYKGYCLATEVLRYIYMLESRLKS